MRPFQITNYRQVSQIVMIGLLFGILLCVAVLLFVGAKIASMGSDGVYHFKILGLPVARGELEGDVRRFVPELGLLLILILPSLVSISAYLIRIRFRTRTA